MAFYASQLFSVFLYNFVFIKITGQVIAIVMIYRVGQIKRGQLTFLLVTSECIHKIK